MKHQYFGDIIDLFKFDLLFQMNNELKLNGITYIPMLTENDGLNQGSKRDYDKAGFGMKNKPLIEFLEEYKDRRPRDTEEITKYFNAINIEFNYFSEKYFTKKERELYFSDLFKCSLENQLLFFDPDNGLEVKYSRNKHILFSELKSCCDIICDNSVIVVIQFRHRQNWANTIEEKKKSIEEKVSQFVTHIANNNIAFFMITRSETQLANVKNFLVKYESAYKG